MWDHHHSRQAAAAAAAAEAAAAVVIEAIDHSEDDKMEEEQTNGNSVPSPPSLPGPGPGSAFGLKYTFELRDKAGEAAVNAPG